MKNSLILFAAMASILTASCSKNKDKVSTKKPGIQTIISASRDGEDDDVLIIIKTKSAAFDPLPGSSVSLDDGITVFPGTTNNSGECSLHVTHLGEWYYHASHDGYVQVYDTLNLVSLVNYRTDTMQEF